MSGGKLNSDYDVNVGSLKLNKMYRGTNISS